MAAEMVHIQMAMGGTQENVFFRPPDRIYWVLEDKCCRNSLADSTKILSGSWQAEKPTAGSPAVTSG